MVQVGRLSAGRFPLVKEGGQPSGLFRPSTDSMRLTHITEGIDFNVIQKSTDLNVNLIQIHPHRNVWALWAT